MRRGGGHKKQSLHRFLLRFILLYSVFQGKTKHAKSMSPSNCYEWTEGERRGKNRPRRNGRTPNSKRPLQWGTCIFLYNIVYQHWIIDVKIVLFWSGQSIKHTRPTIIVFNVKGLYLRLDNNGVTRGELIMWALRVLVVEYLSWTPEFLWKKKPIIKAFFSFAIKHISSTCIFAYKDDRKHRRLPPFFNDL